LQKLPVVSRKILEYASQYNEPFLARWIVSRFIEDGYKMMTPSVWQAGGILSRNGYESITIKGQGKNWWIRKSDMFIKSDNN